jgi:transposase-like protein
LWQSSWEKSGMGRRGYPPEFRRKVLGSGRGGWSVAKVAKALGISDESISTRRWQDRIDRGVEPA